MLTIWKTKKSCCLFRFSWVSVPPLWLELLVNLFAAVSYTKQGTSQLFFPYFLPYLIIPTPQWNSLSLQVLSVKLCEGLGFISRKRNALDKNIFFCLSSQITSVICYFSSHERTGKKVQEKGTAGCWQEHILCKSQHRCCPSYASNHSGPVPSGIQSPGF